MKTRTRPIIILGFMGAGKTTVAAVLARQLACTMIDLDSFLTEREGRTPQMIIDEDGEQRFRQLESEALRDALEKGSAPVIALGGGTWMLAGNRSLINEHGGFTIWLDAPFNLCWERISVSESNSRPFARDRASARELYDKRRAIYDQAIMRIEVSADKSVEMIAAEIAEALS